MNKNMIILNKVRTIILVWMRKNRKIKVEKLKKKMIIVIKLWIHKKMKIKNNQIKIIL